CCLFCFVLQVCSTGSWWWVGWLRIGSRCCRAALRAPHPRRASVVHPRVHQHGPKGVDHQTRGITTFHGAKMHELRAVRLLLLMLADDCGRPGQFSTPNSQDPAQYDSKPQHVLCHGLSGSISHASSNFVSLMSSLSSAVREKWN
ncbi:hypothetical protein EI94DRAFT_1752227, partial [Lactarius quietus]